MLDAIGETCPNIDGSIKPAKDIKGFKSEIWPATAALIAEKLGGEIPPEENIFYDDASKQALSIDECVEKILSVFVATDCGNKAKSQENSNE